VNGESPSKSLKMMKEDNLDILPDTNTERERTTTGNFALALGFVGVVFILTAFVTPNWLEGDPRFYGTKFEKLGLWSHCFRSLPDYNDITNTRFYAGCRWIFNPFTEGYDQIRYMLVPPFFVATQFFFTLCFVAMLIAIGMVLMFLLCIDEYYRVKVLRWIGFDLMVGGICGTIALIIFGAEGDGRYFMPDWEHNYLSWSFGLAFVGVLLMYVVSVLFLVEARIINRKEIAREMKDNPQYPMERTV